MNVLARVASRSAVPVYPAVGRGGEAMLARLASAAAVAQVRSVRHASVLLVAGKLRESDAAAVKRLHDQMPHSRGTLWWGSDPIDDNGSPVTTPADDDPLPALRSLDRALLSGVRQSEPDWLPDKPPNPWRGQGQHGQGGKGMMGGTPYGRPMAMTADDIRDGLALDAMTVTIGPFLPMLPPGLALEISLQGDVIQSARVVAPPYLPDQAGGGESLLRAARLLDLLDLGRLAVGCRQAANHRHTQGGELLQRARRAGAFLAIPPELGDVRERLGNALSGDQANTTDDAHLVDRLPGLEWQTALLLINSFDAATLQRIAPVVPREKQESSGAGAIS